jgi:hypothetical protein
MAWPRRLFSLSFSDFDSTACSLIRNTTLRVSHLMFFPTVRGKVLYTHHCSIRGMIPRMLSPNS